MNEALQNDQVEERFFIRGRMEILDIVNDLIHRHEPVTVSFGNGAASFVTRLLEARGQQLVFETDANAAGLPPQGACVFIARPDGILVRFAGEQAQRISWGGSEALCVPLPQCIARRQRQESLRVRIPAAAGLLVHLFGADGGSLGAWPLRDLSVGGLGLMLGDPALLATGNQIARASLDLPALGVVDCPVCMRHASAAGADGDDAGCRIGLGFRDLPTAMRAMIQRYIISLEHQRRADGGRP